MAKAASTAKRRWPIAAPNSCCRAKCSAPIPRPRTAIIPNATARKLYAFAAWVAGTEGFDSRLYIASGQRDAATAERLALDACTKATRQRCELLAFAGNGFIQTYRLGVDDHSATAETSAKRAAQAAQLNCKKRKQACTLQRVYDSRTPGEFVHDFMAPASK